MAEGSAAVGGRGGAGVPGMGVAVGDWSGSVWGGTVIVKFQIQFAQGLVAAIIGPSRTRSLADKGLVDDRLGLLIFSFQQ